MLLRTPYPSCILFIILGTITSWSAQGFPFSRDHQPPLAPPALAQTLEEPYELTIIHTNDVHARFAQFDKYGGPCTKPEEGCYGGVARRHTLVKDIRSRIENVLLLDGGDQYQGTLWFVYYKGRAAQHFMNLIDYDVMALGNHEFDNGVEGLRPFLQNVTFPVVCANLDASRDSSINGLFNKSVVVERGGRKIGIIGVVTLDTPNLVNPKGIRNLVFQDEVTALKAEVQRLQAQGVDIIIALSHSGFGMDKTIASQVDGLDVVVGGHTNTFLYTGEPPSNDKPVDVYPTIVNSPSGKKVYIVQDYTYGKYLGMLNLTFNANGEVLSATGNPILLDSSINQDPVMLAQVEQYEEPLSNYSKKVIGETLVYLEGFRGVCRLQECNMGNVMTEAMLLATIDKKKPFQGDFWSNYSVAIWNSGGIRSSIDIGEFNLENVLAVFPFQNTISVVKLKGKDLLRVLEHAVEKYRTQDPVGAFLQVSGLRIVYDLNQPPGQRVKKVEVKCSNCKVPSFSALEEEKIYSVVTSDFLISGGDGYKVIGDSQVGIESLNILDSAAFELYASSRRPITQGLDNRITFASTTVGAASSVVPTYRLLNLTVLLSLISTTVSRKFIL